MHAYDMPQDGGEIKTSAHIFWTAMYDAVFDHEVVGMHVRTPAPADKSRHAMQPMVMWLWMTKEAAKKDRKRLISGQMVYLRRGQIAVSERYLAEKANWGRKAVRLFLERLVAYDMIKVSSSRDVDQLRLSFPAKELNGIQKGPAISVITLCNYDKYQRGQYNKGPTRAQEGPKRGPGGAQNLTSDIDNIDTEDDHDRGGQRADATVVQLDEHRPNAQSAVREDQFRRYHALGSQWGMRADAAAPLVPLDRQLTDSNLLTCVERYASRNRTLVGQAIDIALTEMENRRHDEIASNAARGRCGFAPCANYFSKALNSAVDRLLLGAAKLEAEARTEIAVQEAVLKKRMNGVENGGQHRSRGRSSWNDLGAEVYGTADA